MNYLAARFPLIDNAVGILYDAVRIYMRKDN